MKHFNFIVIEFFHLPEIILFENVVPGDLSEYLGIFPPIWNENKFWNIGVSH